MKILVLGATGMLGATALRVLAGTPGIEATGTARSVQARDLLAPGLASRVVAGIDASDPDSLVNVLGQVRPDVVINCIGMVKQQAGAADPLVALPINALLPHRLSQLCGLVGARLVHFSTDCVFDGRRGGYTESDVCNAEDLYGRSKLLGEVDAPHAITLRTSIIGPELASSHGLFGWFMAQRGTVRGFRRAIFSGLTTLELSRVVRDRVLPDPQLHGVYHVASEPISKFELLRLIADVYGSRTAIEPEDDFVIDRSLDATRFRAATGYVAPGWRELIETMHREGAK